MTYGNLVLSSKAIVASTSPGMHHQRYLVGGVQSVFCRSHKFVEVVASYRAKFLSEKLTALSYFLNFA